MSEEILRVFLEDLKTLRIVCQQCGAVIELDAGVAGVKMKANECPVCHAGFSLTNGVDPSECNPFRELARVFAYLETVKSKVKIEFPIKAKP